jgi:predicted metal-dependent phosphotriesterase family hydrolase
MSAGLVRTVVGDVSPSDLGVTYMHEHLIIDSPTVAQQWPHILHADVGEAVTEVAACCAAGVGTMVDAMPMASGRGPDRLARISIETGVHIVMTTGLHTEKYYNSMSWIVGASVDQLADWFVDDIEVGVDAHDHLLGGTTRTKHPAGIIKAATGPSGMTDGAKKTFEAAAIASHRTGAPILTHCEEGRGGMEQIELLSTLGVSPPRVALSHTDKVPDAAYHTDLLETGANLEFDQTLRCEDAAAKVSARLLRVQIDRGHGGQLMLGTDGARRSLWASLGGRPGLAWLAEGYRSTLEEVGIGIEVQEALFKRNPQRFLAMTPTDGNAGNSANGSRNESRERT